MDDLFKSYSLDQTLNNLNDFNNRRALNLAFKGNSSYTEVLVYLTFSYLSQLEYVNKNDGFMIKTIPDICNATILKIDRVREILKELEKRKLIVIADQKRGSYTRIKVERDRVVEFLNQSVAELEKHDNDFYEKQSKIQEDKKERLFYVRLDWDKINSLVEENDVEKISEIVSKLDALTLIYVVNYYYKKFTNQNYHWTVKGFFLMLTNWKNNRWCRINSESGLAAKIYESINNPLYPDLSFEENVKYFSPGYWVKGAVCDNILKDIQDNFLKQFK